MNNEEFDSLENLEKNLATEENLAAGEEAKSKNIFAPRWLLLIGAILLLLVAFLMVWLAFNAKKQTVSNKNQTEQEIGVVPAEVAPQREGEIKFLAEKNSLKVGEQVVVKILIDTKEADIVIGSAAVIYDPAVLKLMLASEKNSVLPMAVIKQEKDGEIKIVRGATGDGDYLDKDDGYNGQGILAELTFKALKAGAVVLKFDPQNSGLILDDARGTEMDVEKGEEELVISD